MRSPVYSSGVETLCLLCLGLAYQTTDVLTKRRSSLTEGRVYYISPKHNNLNNNPTIDPNNTLSVNPPGTPFATGEQPGGEPIPSSAISDPRPRRMPEGWIPMDGAHVVIGKGANGVEIKPYNRWGVEHGMSFNAVRYM